MHDANFLALGNPWLIFNPSPRKLYQRKWLLKYLMHCSYEFMIPIMFTVHVFIISIFRRHLLYKLGTISGTKYSGHWSISYVGVIGILEGYKTWQVIAYVTVEHATQCTKYFLFVRFFHKNMINTGCGKLGNTSRQRYIRQIPVWHHSGHVRHYILISVFYKINIRVSGQNDVFPVIKLG